MPKDTPLNLPRLLITISSALFISAFAVILSFGYHYYVALPSTRAFSADHHIFGAAGTVGLWVGITAAALFVTNLAYLPRKLWRSPRSGGSMRAWLDWHVVSGLLAALLVPLHAAFEMRTTVGKTCVWALGVVIVTGLIGRYMVWINPRSRHGDDVSLNELEEELMPLLERLRPRVKHDQRAIDVLQRVADVRRAPSLTLGDNIRKLRQIKREMAYLQQVVAVSTPSGVDVTRTIRRAGKLYARATSAGFLSRMMDAWRAFHRALSLLFIVALGVHIGSMFYLGIVRF